MKSVDISDIKWAHPECAQEGGFHIDRPDFTLVPEEQVSPDRSFFRENIKNLTVGVNPDFDNRTWEDFYTVHGCPEEPETKGTHIVISRPNKIKQGAKLPVMFCIAGGGLTGAGTAEVPMFLAAQIARYSKKKVIIMSTEYRLAPFNKYPAAINDLHSSYIWMLEHADELGIDTDKIILWGQSTGGQLVLCTAFRLKRYGWCGGPMPRGVIAQLPVMDDTSTSLSNRYAFLEKEGTNKWAWNGSSARRGMKMWLGERFGDPFLPPEAVPARATLEDIKGLPPIWFPSEAEFDPGRDSVYKFVGLLHEAGIFCDLHMWGGTTHQFNSAEGTDFAGRFQLVAGGALRDAIEFDFRRPWLEK